MKRETYISIPQPCHENWDAMTPQDKGRFCASCAKTVIDFSQMSDTQVLNYLSQSNGRLCGRFAQDQVERPLIPVKTEKKKWWWMAALMPLSLLLNKANGQKKVVKASAAKEITITMGTAAIVRPDPIKDIQPVTKTIKGFIKDEQNNPIPYSTIAFANNKLQTTADKDGYFSLKILIQKSGSKLLISNPGYEEKEIAIDLKDTMHITLKEKQALLPEVCVKSAESYLSGRVGGLVSVVTVARKDTIKTTVRKIFNLNPFKIYPNPVSRGAAIQIEVKSEGHYSIQLLDVNSKLIMHKLLDAEKGITTTSLIIPSATAAGVYFIRLANDDTKQQFTDRIIVE